MRIAVLAHLRHPVAAPFAGGMEAHAFALSRGLKERGHDVVLFAAGDSDAGVPLDAVIPRGYEADFPWRIHRGGPELTAYLDRAYEGALDRIAAGGFDVLHNNTLHALPMTPGRTRRVPTVTSLHVPPFDALRCGVTAGLAPGHRLTVTSAAQLAEWFPDGAPGAVSVLHNGVDPAAWPFVAQGNGEAVWVGRIAPTKGPHLACAAARRAGRPLTLYGPIEDRAYWDAAVAPELGGDVRYGGLLDRAALAEALGRASVLVFTPMWNEPFGLVAIEAMACGLPVAAFDMGAAGEVIGEAGVLAAPGDVQGLARAIDRAAAIPRPIPRARVKARFTQDRWLDGCEALYRRVLDDARPARTAA